MYSRSNYEYVNVVHHILTIVVKDDALDFLRLRWLNGNVINALCRLLNN